MPSSTAPAAASSPPPVEKVEQAARVDPATPESGDSLLPDRELKNRIRRRIIAEIDPDANALMGVPLRQRIEELFSRIVESEGIVLSPVNRDRLRDVVVADLIGFGPLQILLDDATVDEVLVKGPDEVYVKRDGRLVPAGVTFDDELHLRLFVDRMAQPAGRRVDESAPLWEGWLSDNSRIQVAVPPASPNGATVAIQKASPRRYSADDLLRLESLSREMVELLRACVLARLNILVTGAPGAGKTTMLHVLQAFIPPGEPNTLVRIGGAHDVTDGTGRMVLVDRPADARGQGGISPSEVLRHALALRPDRVLLERCAGPEALDMLSAMVRGVRGWLTTVEGASPVQALGWLEHLASTGESAVPPERIRRWMQDSIDLIVHLDRGADGRRRVSSISTIENSGSPGGFDLQEIFVLDSRRAGDAASQFRAVARPTNLVDRVEGAGVRFPVFPVSPPTDG